MWISRWQLKQMLHEERMKALEDAEADNWRREQLHNAFCEVNKLRQDVMKQLAELNYRIDNISELVVKCDDQD